MFCSQTWLATILSAVDVILAEIQTLDLKYWIGHIGLHLFTQIGTVSLLT